jgi:NAD-dependent deacetylase
MTDDGFDTARGLVTAARRIVVLTGAGISTDSGIPDFRGPDGVWTRDPEAEKYSTIGHYLAEPDVRVRAWQHRMDAPVWRAQPNAGHRALVDLERSGRLDLLVTQNIDGLHQAAGSDPSSVVEMHGSVRSARCVACGWSAPIGELFDRVRAGEPDPACPTCGGIVKSDVVFFGEQLRPERVERAFEAAARCDLLLAVGTTLAVTPVAHLAPVAVEAGADLVVVNASPGEYDHLAAAVVRGSISEVLPGLVTPTGD